MSSEQDCEALAGSTDVEIPLELQLAGLASDEDLHLLCRVAVDGCSVAAAADELGIGIEACKKRLQRVRARLKKQMQADW